MKSLAFTLVELLVTLVVAALVIGGVLVFLIHAIILDEYNEKFSIAMNVARAKIEEAISERGNFDDISNEGYALDLESDGIDGSYQRTVAPVAGFTNKLKNIRVVICWRGRGGRVVGEDLNLNGVLDSNEKDPPVGNGDEILDSPCVLTTAIAKR